MVSLGIDVSFVKILSLENKLYIMWSFKRLLTLICITMHLDLKEHP